jgi:hypothetical protein
MPVTQHTPERREPTLDSVERREFLRATARRSLIAIGIAAAAGGALYTTPRLRSFLPETTVYAQATGAGTFTLRGTT